jgi:long-chain acyl-CoA synthetase
MNLAEHVERIARDHPDRPAILFEGESLPYGELNARAAALARTLLRVGVERGDRIAIFLPNIPAFAVVYLAIVRIGAIAVSVNSMFKSDESEHILRDAGTRIVFTTAELLPNVPRDRCPALERVVICEGTPGEAGHTHLDDWIAQGADDPAPLADMAADDPVSILYSSGTTGFPKGVTLTHGNVRSNTRTSSRDIGIRPDDRLACFLPLFHVFGQNYILNGGFEAGATIVLWRRFVPAQVLADIRSLQVTMFFAVPTIYIALLGAGVPKEALSSIRFYFSAATTMPEEISRRWTDVYGHRVHEGYGLTETSPSAAHNHVSRHVFGSVGTAVADTEIRIFDEHDRELPVGAWGEIVIRGPGVMKGYWNRPQETAAALRGGWLHTGDIGRMDADGYVYIVDRVKDMINVSGFKVWPAEVENYLYRIPGVREVAVYGVPDPLKGEAVRVAMVLKEDASLSPDEVIAWCKERIAAYKTPVRVDIVTELPKSATGKILKRKLREAAVAEVGKG